MRRGWRRRGRIVAGIVGSLAKLLGVRRILPFMAGELVRARASPSVSVVLAQALVDRVLPTPIP